MEADNLSAWSESTSFRVHFKTKKHSDGTVEIFTARLVECGNESP